MVTCKIICDFINEQIKLDHNYSVNDLLVLTQLDVMGVDEVNTKINDINNNLYDELLSAANEIHLELDYIKLIDIIKSDENVSHYVFSVNDIDGDRIYCRNSEILFDPERGKYYTKKPYYLGDFYIFRNTSMLLSRVQQCEYLEVLFEISPCLTTYENINLTVYHFTTRDSANKAMKILQTNESLFCQLYDDIKFNTLPPITINLTYK